MMVALAPRKHQTVIVGGVRTPLVKAGNALANVPMTDLARSVIAETLYRLDWPASRLDEVILGNVVMPADAANPARVAAMQAGVPEHVPALTVHRNCASGMEAVMQAVACIRNNGAKTVIAAGAESMSAIPLIFPKETLAPMTRLAKARTLGKRFGALAALRPRHFRPVPALLLGLTDPLCHMIMGKTAEVLAHEFNISRLEQDQFALQSHRRAAAAIKAGRFKNHLVPIYAGDRFKPICSDIGPRSDQTLEALARLKPIFDKRDGTVTVGNACQVTDGAAAVMVADPQVAHSEGLEVLAVVRGCAVAGLDPARMGLGPVYAINQVLTKAGLGLDEIDLFEINEAFAAQVLACARAMASNAFCQSQLGRSGAVGELDLSKVNVNGGAIALGHPVGATGTRLVLDLLVEMQRRDAHLGIASLCVAGGQGAAILLERI